MTDKSKTVKPDGLPSIIQEIIDKIQAAAATLDDCFMEDYPSVIEAITDFCKLLNETNQRYLEMCGGAAVDIDEMESKHNLDQIKAERAAWEAVRKS
jgi:hypothetical protein